jgi:hypothetical protein
MVEPAGRFHTTMMARDRGEAMKSDPRFALNFRFHSHELNMLDSIVAEWRAEADHHFAFGRITRSFVIRCLIEREWGRLNAIAQEKLERELNAGLSKKTGKKKRKEKVIG